MCLMHSLSDEKKLISNLDLPFFVSAALFILENQ